MKLVIVESPTKARTISAFLGGEYKIESSYGHIRDLPKSKLGIDLENDFQPQYVIPVKARKQVNSLKKEAGKAEMVILATDEDREGEAIAWHLIQALSLGNPKSEIRNPKVDRIVFHEITKNAIEKALKNPRGIDMDLVNAQQARRVLDRLVGYLLSPFLWKKIFRGLSAGRVQSVALRLIAEREEEIKNFKTEEYWTIFVILQKLKFPIPISQFPNTFETFLYKINGEVQPKLGIKNQKEAEKIVEELKKCEFRVFDIQKKEVRKNPMPPFTTSTLQQEANKRFRMSAKQTMRLAQNLYENGLITYMRTDSVNLSGESVGAAKNWIGKNLGSSYLLEGSRVFKNKSRLAQEAHEAIRPTNPNNNKPELEKNELRLYELIWRRFMASQMPAAIFDATSIEVETVQPKVLNSNVYVLKANGNILRFDGFLKIWQSKFEEKEVPELEKDEGLDLLEIKPSKHFTEPPSRYNEANLIKILEENGIGRPSTYAPTISVIQGRNYVEKNADRRFQPTDIGLMVNKLLTEHFPEVIDISFTAQLEEELDEIAEGKKEWHRVIEDFYTPFSKNLEVKYEEVSKINNQSLEKTNEVCEKCGKPMVFKISRFGKFLGCSGFPECRSIKKINNATEDFGKCEKCGEGMIKKKRTKKGRFFYGCSRYPECDYASWTKPENKELEIKNKEL